MLTAVRHEDIITLWLYTHHTGIQPSGNIGRTMKKNRMITFTLNKKGCNIFLFKQPTWCTNYSNLFCYKTLHFSSIVFAHHQEFSTVHSALVSFMQVLMTASKQSQAGTAVPS